MKQPSRLMISDTFQLFPFHFWLILIKIDVSASFKLSRNSNIRFSSSAAASSCLPIENRSIMRHDNLGSSPMLEPNKLCFGFPHHSTFECSPRATNWITGSRNQIKFQWSSEATSSCQFSISGVLLLWESREQHEIVCWNRRRRNWILPAASGVLSSLNALFSPHRSLLRRNCLRPSVCGRREIETDIAPSIRYRVNLASGGTYVRYNSGADATSTTRRADKWKETEDAHKGSGASPSSSINFSCAELLFPSFSGSYVRQTLFMLHFVARNSFRLGLRARLFRHTHSRGLLHYATVGWSQPIALQTATGKERERESETERLFESQRLGAKISPLNYQMCELIESWTLSRVPRIM